jgi:hypothetical protein
LFDFLATLAPGDSLVWDCACGNGQAGHLAADDAGGAEALDSITDVSPA